MFFISIIKEIIMFSLNEICKCIFAGLCYLLLFISCTTTKQTLYLQQAEVNGPISQPPIHLTDSSDTPSVTFSPKLSYNTKNTFTGNVKQSTGLSSTDTIFVASEHSLVWDMSTVYAGLDIDFKVSRSFAISLGVNYSSQSNFEAWGGIIGIGLSGYNKGSAFRFDVGLNIQSMRYDAYTIVTTVTTGYWGETDEYIAFYNDVGKSTSFNPYLNFTYNTAYKNWPVNLFINAGYSIQTLFNFEPRTSYYAFGTYTVTDLRGKATAGFINFTPGIYFFLGESNRILLGSRFFMETQIDGANPTLFILPMIQFDFVL
jgi:hypothetical protein